MPNKFDKLAKQAAEMADEEFKIEFSRLTRLNDNEIEKIIDETGISKRDLADVLSKIKDSTASNESKAKAIQNINNGVSALVGIVRKLI